MIKQLGSLAALIEIWFASIALAQAAPTCGSNVGRDVTRSPVYKYSVAGPSAPAVGESWRPCK